MSRRDEIIKQVYANSKLEKSGISEIDMARIGEGYDAALEVVWNFVNDNKEILNEEIGEIIEIGKLSFFIDEISGDE